MALCKNNNFLLVKTLNHLHQNKPPIVKKSMIMEDKKYKICYIIYDMQRTDIVWAKNEYEAVSKIMDALWLKDHNNDVFKVLSVEVC